MPGQVGGTSKVGDYDKVKTLAPGPEQPGFESFL